MVDTFFQRADDVIRLANSQLRDIDHGRVSESLLYGAARYTAWLAAKGFSDGDDMGSRMEELIEYFVQQYRGMLADNIDDYIGNFDQYMTRE